MEVRRLTVDDVKAAELDLRQLFEAALRDSPMNDERHDGRMEDVDRELDRAGYSASYRTVVTVDAQGLPVGVAIGCVGGVREKLPRGVEDDHPGFAAGALFLVWIAVHPDARRQWLATRLLDELEAYAEAGRAWGLVDLHNKPAGKMYQRRGWMELGRSNGQVVMGGAAVGIDRLGWPRPSAEQPQAARRWHRRGHLVVMGNDHRWRLAATGRFLRIGSNPDDPPCTLCGRPPTPEGYDPCLRAIPGATSVCCGHGVAPGHVKYPGQELIQLPFLTKAPGSYSHPIPPPGR